MTERLLPNNAGPTAPGFSKGTRATREAKMAAFDALPPEVRDVINYSPLFLDPIKTGELARQHGLDGFIRGFYWKISTTLPDWKPLPGEPI